jgi:hypothetical protein
MSSSNWSNAGRCRPTKETVEGYFASADDATNAIHELVDDGFSINDIGAAYHSGAGASGRSAGQESRPSSTATSAEFPSTRAQRAGEGEGDFPLRFQGNQDLNPAGATSDTQAVSPWGLFTGGGTPFAGASRPGPITGSEIPPEIPRELPSDLAPEQGQRAAGSYAYSCSAFENSFGGMGIPPEHARRLSRELRRGGAVVTVKAGQRTPAAEQIMERNHGTIRYDSGPVAVEEARGTGEQVDVFGEVHRVYPGYIPAEDARRRKAS